MSHSLVSQANLLFENYAMRFFRSLFVIILFKISLPLQATHNNLPHDVAEHLNVENVLTLSQSISHDIIAAADWGNATRVEILLDDYFYQPENLVFEPEHAYILTVKNVGSTRHDISGEQFFSNIVVKQIRHRGLTVNAYHVESIHVPAGGEVDVWLVARKTGEFPFICKSPGHLMEGMEGLLTVKPKSTTQRNEE